MTTTEPSTSPALDEAVEAHRRLLAHLDPPLPSTLFNLLAREGYKTVADVAAVSDADLLKVREIGESSLAIIRAALAGDVQPPPSEHSPLSRLNGVLHYELLALLADAGLRTAEEVAAANTSVLRDLLFTGALEVRAIHAATLA
ncbi:hypothetical protein OG555_18835 [Kribbella sp. NBC_01484]|uniref:DNA-directed RNA polymerase subunit alpha C-terminal domain-containing protein n=1 Tax=Kribbella sp. NBC_01484 TaxID=2903579 RepID=UPI002E32FFDD|nr:DNA-directed RNA polymerase subunit alpha C-terminal domain-containing protein [Kribbella sp. NBC_01484]